MVTYRRLASGSSRELSTVGGVTSAVAACWRRLSRNPRSTCASGSTVNINVFKILNGYNYSSLNVFDKYHKKETTRSQAVAGIADRTASQYAEPDSQIAMVRPSRIPNLKSLAQVVLEILMPQWFTWPWTTSKQRSKSIHFGTNQFLIYDFL